VHAIRIAFAALATTAVLSSCSGSSARHDQTPTVPLAHDAADVAFVKNMIPHHQQAVDMAAMVPSRTTNSQMWTIAKDISSGQQAEIYAMTKLLDQWGESGDHDTHAGHGGMPGMQGAPGMQGMVDPATMNQLQTLRGNAFDTLWMRAMIGHHQGAVVMGRDEITHGQSKDAIDMARIIVTSQQREIAYMNHLLSPTE
jgi:uncharacterized protein (DUF305 family)